MIVKSSWHPFSIRHELFTKIVSLTLVFCIKINNEIETDNPLGTAYLSLCSNQCRQVHLIQIRHSTVFSDSQYIASHPVLKSINIVKTGRNILCKYIIYGAHQVKEHYVEGVT